MTAQLTPIPQPKPHRLFGNMLQVDTRRPIASMVELSDPFGEICQLQMPGQRLVLLRSQRLVQEVSNDERFDKRIHNVFKQIRLFAGDGLFTADSKEPNWGSAHRIAMPAFARDRLKEMVDPMKDIIGQALLKWERQGDAHAIEVSEDMTRITLDSIGLCAFHYRFNSFYQPKLDPFVGAMARNLKAAGYRARRPKLFNRLLTHSNRQFEADTHAMHDMAEKILAERARVMKRDGQAPTDLLHRMLQDKDPLTGAKLSLENIRYQIVTFLVAGHETTSALLDFALVALLENPSVLRKAMNQIDEVLGDRLPNYDDLARLGYIDQILKECLRLWPTAPSFGRYSSHGDTVIGGKYEIKKDDVLLVLVPALHRDPAVWGEDANEFRPERMELEKFRRLPRGAFKPFGTGQRACTGSALALLEATLALTMILQRFEISKADPEYQLQVDETPSFKPVGLRIFAKSRLRSFAAMPKMQPATASAQPEGRCPYGHS